MERRDDGRPPVVLSIVGRGGTGKTGVLCHVVERLRAMGYVIDTVKHAPDHDAIDRPGSDSERHRAAGARRTLLVGARDVAVYWGHEAEDGLDAIIGAGLPGAELILVEGGKGSSYPKIEVYRREAAWPEGPLAGEIDVLAVVTDDPVAVPDETEVIPRRNLERLVDLIEEIIERGR